MMTSQDLLTFEWAWVISIWLQSPTVIYRISPVHNDPYYLRFIDFEAVARYLLESDKIDVVYITTHEWSSERLYVTFELHDSDKTKLGRTTKWV